MDNLLELKGIVIRGKNRGKKLGFPTANFPADPSTPKGTFFSITDLEGIQHPSITFIGTVDTYDEKDFLCETYILNFDQDFYGKEIKVYVLEKIRDNKKFESEEALIKEIENDKRLADEYFRNKNGV